MNATISNEDWTRYRELLRSASGIWLPDSRRGDLAKALESHRTAIGARDLDQLFARVCVPGAEREALVNRLTINETHFWRNAPQFRALEQHVLPALIKEAAPRRRLRIWSAACSSGEEPYSMAMMVTKLLGLELKRWSIEIIATDIDSEVLRKARAGQYGSWSFRECPEEIKQRFFTPLPDGKLEVKPDIRKLVRFERGNLLEGSWPMAGFDLILCRNVLIYFEADTIKKLAKRFHTQLRDGGWLVVGHSEPSQETFKDFTTRTLPGTVLYQRVAKTAPAAKPIAAAPVRPKQTPAEMLTQARRHADRRQLHEGVALVREVLKTQSTDARAHELHGLLLQEQGADHDALAALRRATFLDPSRTLAQFALAQVMARTGQSARAGKLLDTVEQQLTGRAKHERVNPDEQITVGRLLDLVVASRQIATAS